MQDSGSVRRRGVTVLQFTFAHEVGTEAEIHRYRATTHPSTCYPGHVDAAWTAVDDLLEAALGASDPALEASLARSSAAGLPPINVTALQGKFLHLLARAVGARRILEVGTLGGYSTIWLARALVPGGRVTTLELDPAYAEVARRNLADAGLHDSVDIVVGPAIESMRELGDEPFDFTFIDADKASTADYFHWAVAHSRAGALIVVDNVVRRGAIVDGASGDENVAGVRRFLAAAGADPRVAVTALQTVGGKGHDGFALAMVTTAT